MLSTSRRAAARRGTRVGAIVASAAVVVTLVPALLLSSPSNAASTRAAASSAPAGDSVWSATSSRAQASLNGHKRRVNPSASKAYTLNAGALTTSWTQRPTSPPAGRLPRSFGCRPRPASS